MAIDPTTTTTVKVGELGSAGYSTTDLIPHEVGGILKKGNLQDLATFIGEIIDVTGGVGFRAVEVNDGETLPATEDQEFILVGPGTYPNVGGGATITTTEPLNALVSNGTYWFIGVEIPITASGVWGTITGVLSDQTDLNNVLVAKADLVGGKVPNSQLPSYVDDVVEVANYAALPATGETGKIYVTVDTGNIYRWSGSAYIRIADESPVWGIITGDLEDQTDLQAALDGKFDVPTGDTTQYIAGDGSLITFPVAGQAGTIVREVKNTTGATLTKGTVVYINGASGNKPTVTKAIATGDSTSAQTFGLIQADLANNATGYVVCVGDIIGLNTSAFAEGTQLYLSSTTAGAYTSTKQYAPAHLVYIGVVTRSSSTLGQIEVRIQNGYELDELHDVAISSVANNEVIVYESATSLWKNKTIPTILGYTPANSATTLTINGTAYDLSTNRSWTIPTHDAVTIGTASGLSLSGQVLSLSVAHSLNTGALSSTDWTTFNNKIGGSGTTNYVPKFTSSGAIGNSNILDNGSYVEILTAAIISGNLNVNGVVSSGTPSNSLSIISNSGAIFVKNSASNTAYAFQLNTSSGLDLWSTNSGGTSTRRLTLDSSGNLGIGTTSPSEKLSVSGGNIQLGAGYKLQYSSTAYMTPENNVSGAEIATGGIFTIKTGGTSERVRVDASGNVGIGTTSPAEILHLQSSQPVIRYTKTGILNWKVGVISGNTFTINNDSSGGDVLNITSGGNVGIGTTSPTQLLQVVGGIGEFVRTGADSQVRVTASGVANTVFGFNNSGSTSVFGVPNNTSYLFNGQAYPLVFGTDSTERMRITSGGNVGIGTTSPNAKLDVINNSTYQLRLSSTSSNYSSGGLYLGALGTSDPFYYGFARWNQDNFCFEIGSQHGNSNGGITFLTGTGTASQSEKMRITSGGNVLIGTSTSDAKLRVSGTYNGTQAIFANVDGRGLEIATSLTAGTNEAGSVLNARGAGSGTMIFQTDTTERMRITSSGNVGINTTSPSSGISSTETTLQIENGNVAALSLNNTASRKYTIYSGVSGQLAFYDVTGGSERMRITSGGDVLVGKTAFDYTVSGSQFESNGKRLGITTNTSTSTMFLNRRNSQTGEFISFFYNDGSVGSISTNGTVTAYNVTSDYRLKQDFKPFNGLDLVSKIKVYDYAWKADNSRMNGVIAHELQEVVPYAVTGEKDAKEMQQVDYSKLVPILVQAIQELKAEIERISEKI